MHLFPRSRCLLYSTSIVSGGRERPCYSFPCFGRGFILSLRHVRIEMYYIHCPVYLKLPFRFVVLLMFFIPHVFQYYWYKATNLKFGLSIALQMIILAAQNPWLNTSVLYFFNLGLLSHCWMQKKQHCFIFFFVTALLLIRLRLTIREKPKHLMTNKWLIPPKSTPRKQSATKDKLCAIVIHWWNHS